MTDASVPPGEGVRAAAPAGVPEEGGWREALPEDLRGDAAFAKYASVAALARAYRDLERYQGRSIALPGARAGDDAWQRVYERLGRPRSPSGYAAPAVPEGLEVEEGLLARIAEAAHRHGLSDRQHKGLVEDVLGAAHARRGEARTEKDAARKEAMAALKRDWGAGFEANAEDARRALRTLGFPEALAREPRVLARFHEVAAALGEDRAAVGAARGGFEVPASEARRRIDAIRADGAHAFNDASHPGHAEAVREMEALYAALYPA